MLRPGSLVSRLLAVTILVAVLAFAWQGMILPVVAAYRTTGETIAQSRILLGRYEALASQRPQLARALDERRSQNEASSAYLSGANDALAAAALQEQVRTVIAEAGGELRSTQILPVEVADEELRIRRAGLRLQLLVDIEGLEAILYRLETAEPFLFIDDVTIREQRSGRRREQTESAPIFDVALQVFGYVRTGRPEGAEDAAA